MAYSSEQKYSDETLITVNAGGFGAGAGTGFFDKPSRGVRDVQALLPVGLAIAAVLLVGVLLLRKG